MSLLLVQVAVAETEQNEEELVENQASTHLNTFEIPWGKTEDWGIFKLNEYERKMELIPSYEIDSKTLGTLQFVGYFKVQRLSEIPKNYQKSWAYSSFKILSNMGAYDVHEKDKYKEPIHMDELKKIFKKILPYDAYQELENTGLKKPFITRTELLFLARHIVQADLEELKKEYPNLELNKDTKKLRTYYDQMDVTETYEEDWAIAINYNLLNRYSGYKLNPNKIVTKEEAAYVLSKYAHFYWIVKNDAATKKGETKHETK